MSERLLENTTEFQENLNQKEIERINSLVPKPEENPKQRFCPKCDDEIPLLRLKMGYKLCAWCSSKNENHHDR